LESIYGKQGEALPEILGAFRTRIEEISARVKERTGSAPYEHLICRVKSDESMREKCRRKGLPETPQSALCKVHDAIGVRALALQVGGDVLGELGLAYARQEAPHGSGDVRTMTDRQDVGRLDAVGSGPSSPGRLDGIIGVHQGAVHVEENSPTGGKIVGECTHAPIKLACRLKY